MILVNTFQPLDAPNDSERESRLKQTVIAEVDLGKAQVTVIHGLEAAAGQGVICAQALDWEVSNKFTYVRSPQGSHNGGGTCDPNELVSYRKTGGEWRK